MSMVGKLLLECTAIVLALSLHIKSVTFTNISLLEAETFIYHIPDVPHGSNITSVEWCHQTDKDQNKYRMLAHIDLDNNITLLFHQNNRLIFTNNGSICIRKLTHEDTGNYSCKTIFQDGKVQMHIVCVTLYKVPEVSNGFKIITLVISAISALILIGIIIIIFKCRKKHQIPDQPVYMNTSYEQKTKMRMARHDKKDLC